MTKAGSPWVATIATDPANVGRVAVRAAALKVNGDPVDREVLIQPSRDHPEVPASDNKIKTLEDLRAKLPELDTKDTATARPGSRKELVTGVALRGRRQVVRLHAGAARREPGACAAARCSPSWAPTAPGSRRSTSILPGALAPDTGAVLVDGEPVALRLAARRAPAGVETVHQHASEWTVPGLTAAENLLLDRLRERRGRRLGVAAALLPRAPRRWPRRWGCELSRRRAADDVTRLGVSERQLIALARALARSPRLLDPRRADLGADARPRPSGCSASSARLREQRRRDPLRLAPAGRGRGAGRPRRGAARRAGWRPCSSGRSTTRSRRGRCSASSRTTSSGRPAPRRAAAPSCASRARACSPTASRSTSSCAAARCSA